MEAFVNASCKSAADKAALDVKQKGDPAMSVYIRIGMMGVELHASVVRDERQFLEE